MIIDTHCHGDFSPDSGTTMQELVKEAKKRKIGFILTDHMDLHGYMDDVFLFDPKEYFEALEKYRSDEVGIGIELGLRHEAKEFYEQITREYPFDFVLGSAHSPYRTYDDLQYTHRRLYEGMSLEACYRYYWENIIHAIEENPYIDAFSHVDYPARYHRDLHGGEIPFESIEDLMIRGFRLMVSLGISLEINTRLLNEEYFVGQWGTILRLYKECGGRDVTLGSDSHRADQLGRNFSTALMLVKDIGLNVVSYRQRKKIILLEG